MHFVSFQPKDWREPLIRINRDAAYADQIGFNPMYCNMAENATIAVINACLCRPTTPEVALFFKTRDWYSIDRIEHCQALKDGSKRRPICFPRDRCAELFREHGTVDKISFERFIEEMLPYRFEYLVDPSKIEPIAEIDIRSRFDDDAEFLERVSKMVQGYIDRRKESYEGRDEKMGQTPERAVRDGAAEAWWNWYCMDNDMFIQDYNKIFGSKIGEDVLSMKRVDMNKFDKLVGKFGADPSKKTLDAYVAYMEKMIRK